MVTTLKREDPDSRGRFKILLSSKHKGVKEHPKGKAWQEGYKEVPALLQETLDAFDGKEEDVHDVLFELEKAAKLCPGIWRVEITLRALRDPWNEDPAFPIDGYIMGLLIPFDDKLPMPYFRLLAFQWKDWPEKRPWMKYEKPCTIRLTDGKSSRF